MPMTSVDMPAPPRPCLSRSRSSKRPDAPLDVPFEGQPACPDRQRAERDEPGQPCLLPFPWMAVENPLKDGPGHDPKVPAEVDQHREQGPELNHRGEGRTRIRPPQESRNHPEVRDAADGEELGEALDKAQGDCLDDRHTLSTSSRGVSAGTDSSDLN